MRTASEIHRKLLKGIFAVYKPPMMSHAQMIDNIKMKLTAELNRLPLNESQLRLGEKLKRLSTTARDTELGGDSLNSVAVLNKLDQLPVPVHRLEPEELSLHPNVLGEVWEGKDRKLKGINALSSEASGVTVMSIGIKPRTLWDIRLALPIRVYRVQGELGKISNDFTGKSTVLSTYKYDKVTRRSLDRICAGLQAFHQKDVYTKAGLDLSSEAAYRATCAGIIRPAGIGEHLSCIYSIKCVQFKSPYVTLEIHAINESASLLASLVDAIGAGLRCGAVVRAIRRIRYGHFTLSHSLVEPQWTLDGILSGIDNCIEVGARSVADYERRVAHEIGVDSVADKLEESNAI